MLLKHIKTEKCPKCGCSVVIREEIEKSSFGQEINTHCNGQRWEKREFLCGYTTEYVPNFEREKEYSGCENTTEYKKKQAERDSLQKQISDLEKRLRDLK
jgi:hypothetical protein